MRVTREAEYAVRCVFYLCGRPDELISRKEVAQAMEIPPQFLGKIAQKLARAGILEIIQGAKGGYRLMKGPEEISLLEVVEAVMGEIFLNDCILKPQSCSRSVGCAVYRVWQKARNQLRHTLKEATMARLLEQETCLLPLENVSDLSKKC